MSVSERIRVSHSILMESESACAPNDVREARLEKALHMWIDAWESFDKGDILRRTLSADDLQRQSLDRLRDLYFELYGRYRQRASKVYFALYQHVGFFWDPMKHDGTSRDAFDFLCCAGWPVSEGDWAQWAMEGWSRDRARSKGMHTGIECRKCIEDVFRKRLDGYIQSPNDIVRWISASWTDKNFPE